MIERPDPTVYEARVDRYRAAMDRWGVDLLFLNFGPDLYYLSGVLTPRYYFILKSAADWVSGLWLPRDGAPFLTLSRSMAVDAAEQTWISDLRVIGGPGGRDFNELRTDEDPVAFFNAAARSVGSVRSIGTTDKVWAQTAHHLREAFPQAQPVILTPSMMDGLRMIKDPFELRMMAKAAEITDLAMGATLRQLRPGMTERDVAVEVEYQIRRFGGDGYSFQPGIICVKPGSETHRSVLTRNTDLVLTPGTSIAFDFGVLYQGYCSDFGRSAFVDPPDPEALRAYAVITEGVREACALFKDGAMSPAGMCEWFNEYVGARGFGDAYWYLGLGHGIGLEVHEDPRIRPGFDKPVRTNMCFTLEPKIWRHGRYYVRSEDVVVVGPEGSTPLTRFTYAPLVIA
ncbi:MAG: Xaa-Pro peptidase family protein [Armatimonadota bacterium]|nr:Xaa-Pro peptidase family protein [Armatimonadota bacterium]